MISALILAASLLLSCGPAVASRHYTVSVESHAALPVLSSANAAGAGHSDCLVFNPSIVEANPPHFNRSGLLVRECCGKECYGHGRRRLQARGPLPQQQPPLPGPSERISWADCDLLAGTCSDVDQSFVLDPAAASEDPRALFFEGYYYLFYYGAVPKGAKEAPCSGDQCTVQLSRTKTPLDAASWAPIAMLPWHRNGCCHVRPKGEVSTCMWGEGPGPFPGLGISTTTDFASGNFTQVKWDNASSATPSPVDEATGGMWLLPLGAAKAEIKLEAGTHMHPLSTGDLLTFYAAATPGWVAHGNYTVGWLVLDGRNPTRILQRSEEHVLIPTTEYETLCDGAADCRYHGERKNVIFASSAMPTATKKDEFRLYFGGGDGNVGTAVVQVTAVEDGKHDDGT